MEPDVVICSECEREVPAADAHLVLGDIYECDDCFERKRAESSAPDAISADKLREARRLLDKQDAEEANK